MPAPVPDYKVRLEVFEGPLDLLLYLIRKDEINIYDIPIERIASEYLQYVDMMRMLDLTIAGEFLVMAATLMMIKSRMLLPEEERAAEGEDPTEEEDPRWELVRRLVEYKKFKDAAQFLQQIEQERVDVFTRPDVAEAAPGAAAPPLPLGEVSIFDLLTAFQTALQRIGGEDLREIFAERFTVGEKIDQLLEQIRERGELSLTEMLLAMRSRHEMVVTFLAMLELIRLQQLVARQDTPFGEIVLQTAVA